MMHHYSSWSHNHMMISPIGVVLAIILYLVILIDLILFGIFLYAKIKKSFKS
jgi:hypothetical protein